MNQLFSLAMPQNVYCGSQSFNAISKILSQHKSRHISIFTDQGIAAAGLLTPVIHILNEANVVFTIYDSIPSEPSYQDVQTLLNSFLASGSDFIIAIGGGSVMDTAKLASVASENYTVHQLLETPSLAKKHIKSLMIPTTAGTGAEATPNAIVAVPEKSLKVGIINTEMIPDFVILNPEMTRSLPRSIAASTGVDALCHAIECFTSKKSTPFSDFFALEALRIILSCIEPACNSQDDLNAKAQMLMGAFYAGIAITCSGTTAVHALSYPLGGTYHIPHGVSNAMLLVPVMKFNEPYCRSKFATIYDLCLSNHQEELTESQKSERLIEKLVQIVKNLNIPVSLKSFGVPSEDICKLVEAGMSVQRLLANNLRPVTYEDAKNIYLSIL